MRAQVYCSGCMGVVVVKQIPKVHPTSRSLVVRRIKISDFEICIIFYCYRLSSIIALEINLIIRVPNNLITVLSLPIKNMVLQITSVFKIITVKHIYS